MARLIGSRVLFRTVMVVLAVLYGFPMIWMVMSSFKTNRETFGDPLALPSRIDLGVWADAWRIGNLGRYAVNSTIVTTATVVLILLLAALAAYAFSRFEFGGSPFLLGLLLLGLLMPLQSYFIAQNSMFEELGLKDTRLALILPYTAMGLPLAVYLLKVFLDSLPDELFDAARIDGCGDLRMFTALVLPLLKPGLATVAIFSALNAWNEFLLALLYISDDALKTLPTGLLAFSDRYTTDYQLLFSALSIITLPMVAVYVVFHRQIVAGVTEGAVH
jgi:raffinose/stachyose/melibiose transport system permease protein